MTPSRIDFVYKDKEIRIPGEALARIPGQPDFVVYAAMIKGWSEPNDLVPLTQKDRVEILNELKSGLKQRNIAFEIEDEDIFLGANRKRSVQAGQPCPDAGWWFTPAASNGARRYFGKGAILPVIENSDYGATFWQWSPDQSASRL